jgi:hypothetical protein
MIALLLSSLPLLLLAAGVAAAIATRALPCRPGAALALTAVPPAGFALVPIFC